MRAYPVLTLPFLGLLVCSAAAGCGDDPGRLPAATIRVISEDIDETAVNVLRLSAIPRGDSAFIADPELLGDGFIEGLSSRVENGTFVLEANAGYIEDNFFLPEGGGIANFAIDIPVFNVQEETFRGDDPELLIEVVRNGEVIGDSDEADSDGFLTIPLDPEAGPLTRRVACKTVPGPMGDPMPLPQCQAVM